MKFHFVVGVLAALATGAEAQDESIDFARLGKEFLAAHCAVDAEPEELSTSEPCSLEDVLKRGYANVRLGAFELHYPVALFDGKHRAQDFCEVALGLVDLQQSWIEWLTAGAQGSQEGLADLALVRSWVAEWQPKPLEALAKKSAGAELELFTALAAPAEVRSAEQRLYALLHDAGRLGLGMRADTVVRIVLCPTRLDFMQWVAYSGLADPAAREAHWQPGVDQWTQLWIGWTLVAALEYAPWDGFDPEFRSGKSMTSIDKTGMVEQVALQASQALLRFCVPRDLEHADNAVAMNLVIDFVGQLNTIDGEGQLKTSGGQTQPYSRFVPGGNPGGGTLPPRSAAGSDALVKSQWREDNGSDHFLGALAKGQKEGHKVASKEKVERWKDERAHFLLKGEASKHVVSAPFFGPHAAAQEYPPFEFLNDYSEFFRAYKSGFFHWLREVAGDPESPEASRAKFRELLTRFGEIGQGGRTFDDLAAEVYGLPLSAADGETDSLEWRFLAYVEEHG